MHKVYSQTKGFNCFQFRITFIQEYLFLNFGEGWNNDFGDGHDLIDPFDYGYCNGDGCSGIETIIYSFYFQEANA